MTELWMVEIPEPGGDESGWREGLPAFRRGVLAGLKRKEAQDERANAYALEAFVLAAWTGIPARELRLQRDGRGKPFLPDFPGLHYSLSHTDGLAFLGVGDEPVGVDAQRIGPVSSGVVRRCFGEKEAAWCAGSDEACTAVWTRKEAAVKWTGQGLAQSLRGIDTLSAEWAGRLSTVRHGGWMLSVCRRERMELDSIREADAEMLWAFCRESAAGGIR